MREPPPPKDQGFPGHASQPGVSRGLRPTPRGTPMDSRSTFLRPRPTKATDRPGACAATEVRAEPSPRAKRRRAGGPKKSEGRGPYPQPVHQRSVRPGPLVLGTAPLSPLAPTADRDRTVSRRSEPSSRATLMGEQPNPWDLLQPQDVTSRHRGAKPPVDVSSWGRSACYPRSTFYPLSDGPSIRDHRITMP